MTGSSDRGSGTPFRVSGDVDHHCRHDKMPGLCCRFKMSSGASLASLPGGDVHNSGVYFLPRTQMELEGYTEMSRYQATRYTSFAGHEACQGVSSCSLCLRIHEDMLALWRRVSEGWGRRTLLLTPTFFWVPTQLSSVEGLEGAVHGRRVGREDDDDSLGRPILFRFHHVSVACGHVVLRVARGTSNLGFPALTNHDASGFLQEDSHFKHQNGKRLDEIDGKLLEGIQMKEEKEKEKVMEINRWFNFDHDKIMVSVVMKKR